MYAPIFAICFASAAVKAALGAAPLRLYLFGEAPQGVTRPYAVWQTVGGAPENYLGQAPDLDGYSLQVDVYADTAASARAVAAALRDAIEPHAHIVRWGGESKDPETKVSRLSFDVDWLTPR